MRSRRARRANLRGLTRMEEGPGEHATLARGGGRLVRHTFVLYRQRAAAAALPADSLDSLDAIEVSVV
jgi:hypothetical protein